MTNMKTAATVAIVLGSLTGLLVGMVVLDHLGSTPAVAAPPLCEPLGALQPILTPSCTKWQEGKVPGLGDTPRKVCVGGNPQVVGWQQCTESGKWEEVKGLEL